MAEPGTSGLMPSAVTSAASSPGMAEPGTSGLMPSAVSSPAGLVQAAVPPSPQEFISVQSLKDIYFDFDKYDVRPRDAKILDANARWMKSNPAHLILIEGHADERGTNEYNLALGERRAKSTMNHLIAMGVQAGRITIISYGEERLLCPEKNEDCWSKNRRGHFLVKPQ